MSEPTSPVLDPGALARLLDTDPRARVLDVRTPGEFESACIRGASNVPLDSLREHAEAIRRAASGPLVLVCQSGARARRAEEVLRDAGISAIHLLDGGMGGWVAAGLPAERVRPRMSLERQVRIAAGAMVAVGALLALAVDARFALLPAAVGSGLVFAGVTDTCALGMLLARLPYNRGARCDVDGAVRKLATTPDAAR